MSIKLNYSLNYSPAFPKKLKRQLKQYITTIKPDILIEKTSCERIAMPILGTHFISPPHRNRYWL